MSVRSCYWAAVIQCSHTSLTQGGCDDAFNVLTSGKKSESIDSLPTCRVPPQQGNNHTTTRLNEESTPSQRGKEADERERQENTQLSAGSTTLQLTGRLRVMRLLLGFLSLSLVSPFSLLGLFRNHAFDQ